MNRLGIWPLGNGRDVMAAIAAFSNRFRAEFDVMYADDATLPRELGEAAENLSNLANDIAFNGGVVEHWEEGNESTVNARRAAARIILQSAKEIAGAFEEEQVCDTAPPLNKEGKPTEAHFRKCYDALFDVADFAGRVLKGTHMDCFANTDDILEIRRAFALVPGALAAATLFFEEGLAIQTQWAKEHYEASVGPLPPEEGESEPEPEAEADENHAFGDWVVRNHAKAKADFDRLNDCLLASGGQPLFDFLASDSPLVTDLRKRFEEEKGGEA